MSGHCEHCGQTGCVGCASETAPVRTPYHGFIEQIDAETAAQGEGQAVGWVGDCVHGADSVEDERPWMVTFFSREYLPDGTRLYLNSPKPLAFGEEHQEALTELIEEARLVGEREGYCRLLSLADDAVPAIAALRAQLAERDRTIAAAFKAAGVNVGAGPHASLEVEVNAICDQLQRDRDEAEKKLAASEARERELVEALNSRPTLQMIDAALEQLSHSMLTSCQVGPSTVPGLLTIFKRNIESRVRAALASRPGGQQEG